MPNVDRSTVKRALQNIQNQQNDYHQWLSHSFRVHQSRFPPRTPLGSLQRPPELLAGLKGLYFKGEGTDKREVQ